MPKRAHPAPPSDAAPPQGLIALARPTFLAWEKLRLLYVAILAVLTLVLMLVHPVPERSKALLLIIEGAVVANACYFAGPLVETYVGWLGYRERWLRPTLFAAGTAFAILLVVIVLPVMAEAPF